MFRRKHGCVEERPSLFLIDLNAASLSPHLVFAFIKLLSSPSYHHGHVREMCLDHILMSHTLYKF